MNIIKNKLYVQAMDYRKVNIVPFENDYLVRIIFDGMIIEIVLSKSELIDLAEDLIYELKMVLCEDLCGGQNH